MTIDGQRAQFVGECISWIGTKYHAQTAKAVKGAGADCGSFVYEAALNCRLVPEEQLGIHSPDWFCHITEDIYLKRLVRLLRYSYEPVEGVCWPSLDAKPGSILLLKAARSKFNCHSGIVSKWPMIIHAISPRVAEVNACRDPIWAGQKVLVFDPFQERS